MEHKCTTCKDDIVFSSYDGLRRHMGRIHKINSFNFYIQFYWEGKIPTCSCGCTQPLSEKAILLNKLKPDVSYTKYISGHNSSVKNNFHSEGYHERAIETLKKRYESGELVSWQTGHTKDTHEGLTKISEKSKGREFTEEHRKALSEYAKNRPDSHNEKIGATQKRLFEEDPEFRKLKQRTGHEVQKHKALYKYNKQEMKFYDEFLVPIFGADNIEQQVWINGHVVDFYLPANKVIIKYYGDYWHGNPDKYKDDFLIEQLSMTAKEKREKDLYRSRELEYDNVLFIVWENDVKHSPEKVRKQLQLIADAVAIYKV
jgi:hypothetical protein